MENFGESKADEAEKIREGTNGVAELAIGP
jgi:hypothetical protein